MCAKEVKNKVSKQAATGNVELKESTGVTELMPEKGKARKSEDQNTKDTASASENNSTNEQKAKTSAKTDKNNQSTAELATESSKTDKTEKSLAKKDTSLVVPQDQGKEDNNTPEFKDENFARDNNKTGQRSVPKLHQAPDLQHDTKDTATGSKSATSHAVNEAAFTEIDQDASVSEDGKVRRHRRAWLWWLICLLGVILASVQIWLFLVQPWSQAPESPAQPDATTEPSENNSNTQNPEGPSQSENQKPDEESRPPEEPKPDTNSGTEPPKSNQDGQLPPIAQRPGTTDYPDINTGSKLIALTFDDGPSRSTTPRLLDILNNRQTKATFFVLGNMAQAAPEIVRREAAEGHEVASHTPYHHQLTKLSAAQVRAEALEMDRIFMEILGTVPPFTRPPYGSWNATVGTALGQPMILWSIDPRDWADRNANTVCSRVTSAAFDGAIILVHDIHPTTVDAVPCIIDNLRARGYQFLTVSELAAARDVPLVSGVTYGSF